MPQYSNPSFDELMNTKPGQLIYERRGGGPITSVGNQLVVEQRSLDRAHIRSWPEFNRYVEQLLASQPKTLTGYQARLALIEELTGC
jgi:hypothetical protein